MAELSGVLQEDVVPQRDAATDDLDGPQKVDRHGRTRQAFEDELCPGAGYGCVDRELLDDYRAHVGAEPAGASLLTQHQFMREGQLTNAGVLLFAENPTDYLPNACVHLAKFKEFQMRGQREAVCVKDLILDGPLPRLVTKVEDSILQLSDDMTIRDTDGSIHCVEDYPRPAWLDGLLGALMHRSYRSESYIHITIDEDRMQILSPGTPSALEEGGRRGAQNGTRNPRITQALVSMGLSLEGMQSGTSQVERVTTLEEPCYEPMDVLDGNSVRLTLRSNLDAWNQLLEDNEVDGRMLLSPIYSL